MEHTTGIVMINPKYIHNVGGAIRACSCFGVKYLLWTGSRVNPSEYERIPREERMKGYKSVEFRNYDRPFDVKPLSCDGVVPVCVEVSENSEPLTTFEHPKEAVYIFGPEDGSVPQVIRRLCHRFVHIPAHHCLNLSAAINVVLAHRMMSRQVAGIMPILPLHEMLHEPRGRMEVVGWDGK